MKNELELTIGGIVREGLLLISFLMSSYTKIRYRLLVNNYSTIQ